MTLNEKIRKLSEITGINLFDNPSVKKQVREVLGSSDTEGDTSAEPTAEDADKDTEPNAETEPVDGKEEVEDKVVEQETETKVEAEEQTEPVSDCDDAKASEAVDEVAEAESEQEPTSDTGDNSVEPAVTSDELFTAKLEAKLLRAGIREDRLDSAIRLFKLDHTIADINKVANWLKEYPEWTVATTKATPTPFGMSVGENGQGITAEERRFKALGLKD